MKEKIKYNKLLDPQYLDNNMDIYYFIPYPECKFFDEMDDDENVIPINIQGMCGSFVNAEFISCYEEETDK